MEPTPRALELAGPVRQTLRQIERLFENDETFDPATSTLRFAARMSDTLEFLLLPPLLALMRRDAPAMGLDVVHLSPEGTVQALESDKLDLAVSTGLSYPASVRSRVLFRDKMVCIVSRNGGPALRAISMDEFIERRHLRVSISPTDSRFVDNVLAEVGLKRDIALNLPHWVLIPRIIEKTDLIAVMPERLARAIASDAISVVPLPFRAPSFDLTLYWHRRYDGSKAHRWLRSALMTVCKSI